MYKILDLLEGLIYLLGVISLLLIILVFFVWFFPENKLNGGKNTDLRIINGNACYSQKDWHTFDRKDICYKLGEEVK